MLVCCPCAPHPLRAPHAANQGRHKHTQPRVRDCWWVARARYSVAVDGRAIHTGTTLTLGDIDWVARVVLPIAPGSKAVVVAVDKAAPDTMRFNISGATFFST